MLKYEILKGDCLEILPELDDKVELVLTDIPYGTTNCKWDSVIPFKPMWTCLNKVTNDNTPIILFGTEPFSSNLRMSNIKNYKYDWVWDKVVRSGFLNSKKQPLRQYELISVFYKKQPTYNPIMWEGKEASHKNNQKVVKNNVYNKLKPSKVSDTKLKYPTNIIKVNSRSKECNGVNRLHPTQKPVELLEYLIRTYTNENDTVLDFTMGSGSTGVACANTGRKFIGIELDETYFSIAEERIQKAYNGE